MKSGHSERCKECKERVFELLCACFGEVEKNYSFELLASLDSFRGHILYDSIQKIYNALANHRGHKNFVRAKVLPPVDFYVIKDKFIVEFDESQHFTKPREIVLKNYPKNVNMGFDKERWIDLCTSLNKKDNDPPFRDEQRAWYDTIRDFIPEILGIGATVRLYVKDHIWCQLDSKSEEDRRIFQGILYGKRI